MTYANTTLLGLNQPTTGSESGVWGDDVNNGFTQLVDLAVAGTNNITQDSDITLAVSNGNNSSSFTSTATNSTVAQYAILNCTGSRTAARNIIVPASSKLYVVYNNTSGGYAITVKKSGGTGVSVANGEKVIVYYDNVTATDVVKIVSSVVAGTVPTPFTANGVVYASSTSALATGSVLTFDGSTLKSSQGSSGTTAPTNGNSLVLENGSAVGMTFLTPDANASRIYFGTASNNRNAFIYSDYNAGAQTLIFGLGSGATAATEKMRLNSSGYLGIGTSSPSYSLDVNGTAQALRFISTSSSASLPSIAVSSGNGIFNATTNAIGFSTNSTEVMRLDASGNLGIGTSSPGYRLNAYGSSPIIVAQDSGANSTRALIQATNTAVYFGNTYGGSNIPLIFSAGGGSSGAEFARITTSGGFSVGTTADPGAGAIYATGNITAYYSSDIKFKTNVQDIQDPLGIVTAIGSKTFDWTDEYLADHGGEDEYFQPKQSFGVIAQDVQKVFPQAVRTRTDGSLAVDYEKLAILSFGAIGQLLKRVEALESK